MRCFVDLNYRYVKTVVVIQPDERLASRTQQDAVRWCGWTGAECLFDTLRS